MSRKYGGIGVFKALVGVVEIFKGGFSQHSVLALHKGNIAAVGNLMCVSVLINSVGEFYIRIVKHRENRRGCTSHFRCHSNYSFLLGGKNMVTTLENSVK